MTQRPLPTPDVETGAFWAAARDGRLAIRRCQDCHAAIFYPRIVCPECMSDRVEWETSAGYGTIYAVTVVERAPPAFRDLVPYAVALVELDEGPRIMSRLLADDPYALRIGQRVEARFEKQTDEITLPLFTPRPD